MNNTFISKDITVFYEVEVFPSIQDILFEIDCTFFLVHKLNNLWVNSGKFMDNC